MERDTDWGRERDKDRGTDNLGKGKDKDRDIGTVEDWDKDMVMDIGNVPDGFSRNLENNKQKNIRT